MITVLLLSSSNSIVVTWWCYTFTKQAPRKALGGGGSSGAASRAIASAAGGGALTGQVTGYFYFVLASIETFYPTLKPFPILPMMQRKETDISLEIVVSNFCCLLQGPQLGSTPEVTATILNRLQIGRNLWPPSSRQVESWSWQISYFLTTHISEHES